MSSFGPACGSRPGRNFLTVCSLARSGAVTLPRTKAAARSAAHPYPFSKDQDQPDETAQSMDGRTRYPAWPWPRPCRRSRLRCRPTTSWPIPRKKIAGRLIQRPQPLRAGQDSPPSLMAPSAGTAGRLKPRVRSRTGASDVHQNAAFSQGFSRRAYPDCGIWR